MKGQTHGGKGSTPRPTNKRRFDENYENIFNKKAPENQVELDEGIHITEGDGRSGESKFREYAEGQGVQGQADKEQAVEPVAWHYIYNDGITVRETVTQTLPLGSGKHYTVTPLYAHPPKQEVKPVAWGEYKHETVSYGFSVPEDEVEDVFEKINVFGGITQQNAIAQAKLPNGELTSNVYDAFDKGYAQAKIDLAEQAVEQNPVAWIYEKQLADGFSERTLSFGIEPDFDGVITPLYAHSPKQEQAIEQEPVAWRVYYEVNGHYIIFQQFPYGVQQIDEQRGVKRDIQPLYAHPPKRQPLSAKDILHLETKARISFDTKINACEFTRLIEKAHGISDER